MFLAWFFLLVIRLDAFRPTQFRRKLTYIPVFESFFDKLFQKFAPKEPEEPKTENDEMLEYLQVKPWRATKVRNLKICYR
jgi:hypothetical protein